MRLEFMSLCPRVSYINLQTRESLSFDPHTSIKTPTVHAAQFDIFLVRATLRDVKCRRN